MFRLLWSKKDEEFPGGIAVKDAAFFFKFLMIFIFPLQLVYSVL